jgi:hypothetical protein
MGQGWQAEVRRYGRKVYRTFATREEAESYATAIEEELARARLFADAFSNRYSGFVAVWQFAFRELRQLNGADPTNEEIAAHIAAAPQLLQIAGVVAGTSLVRMPETPDHEFISWDADEILAYFDRLNRQREAIEETIELIDRGGEDDDAAA